MGTGIVFNTKKSWRGRGLWALLPIFFTAAFLLAAYGVSAQGDSVFRYMNPADVFEIAIAFDNGTTAYQFSYVNDDLGACDLNQPAATRECHFDLRALAQRFSQITAIEYVPALPVSIQLNADAPGVSPIVLAAEIKTWNTATAQARRWKLVCSIVPETPELAACTLVDRIDHFNYVIVNTDHLNTVRTALTGH